MTVANICEYGLKKSITVMRRKSLMMESDSIRSAATVDLSLSSLSVKRRWQQS